MSMEEERIGEKTMAFLRDEMTEKDRVEFEAYLKANPEVQNEVEALRQLWQDVDTVKIPEPSPQMDQKFFQLLGAEMEKQHSSKGSWQERLTTLFGQLFRPQLAYGILILGFGLGVGYFFRQHKTVPLEGQQMVNNEETEAVRGKLVLTLLEQHSANKRLQGVGEANKLKAVDEQVTQALLKTLNNDDNVNVRLAAIASLTNYVENPDVRQGLVQSIPHQESPIIQVTLANLMLALQEKQSVEPFKKLLEEKELDTSVKKRIEHTIASII